MASTVPLPTYNFDVRAGDLDTWVKVLKDIGEFNGQVDTQQARPRPPASDDDGARDADR